MDTTTDTRMQTPAAGPASFPVERRAALTVASRSAAALDAVALDAVALDPAVQGPAAPDSAVQGTRLPLASRIRPTHAAPDSAWSFGDVRSSELPGPVPRGALV